MLGIGIPMSVTHTIVRWTLLGPTGEMMYVVSYSASRRGDTPHFRGGVATGLIIVISPDWVRWH